jgi:hypothetical protein
MPWPPQAVQVWQWPQGGSIDHLLTLSHTSIAAAAFLAGDDHLGRLFEVVEAVLGELAVAQAGHANLILGRPTRCKRLPPTACRHILQVGLLSGAAISTMPPLSVMNSDEGVSCQTIRPQ